MYGMVSAGTFGVRADATEKFCLVYQKLSTFDYELQDGKIFGVGGVKLHCVLTLRHALGVMSFSSMRRTTMKRI